MRVIDSTQFQFSVYTHFIVKPCYNMYIENKYTYEKNILNVHFIFFAQIPHMNKRLSMSTQFLHKFPD